MRWIGTFTKIWAYAGISAVCAAVLFLFGYVFFQGAGIISVEFLTEAPKGLVLGEEGGIWPAITGSLCFTGTAMVLASVPAAASALYLVFYCRSRRLYQAIRLVIQCISGIPSIVLGLFAYSFLVRDLNLGRCIFSAGVLSPHRASTCSSVLPACSPFTTVEAPSLWQASIQASAAFSLSQAKPKSVFSRVPPHK